MAALCTSVLDLLRRTIWPRTEIQHAPVTLCSTSGKCTQELIFFKNAIEGEVCLGTVFRAHGCEEESKGHLRELEVYKEIGFNSPCYWLRCLNWITDGPVVMEYPEEGPIREYLRRKKHKLPAVGVMEGWALRAAEAIEYLHHRGVLHGDISCGNFFLDRSLRVRLGNFTNSRFFDRVSGDNLGVKDDIFDFGFFLYELRTGIELYHGLSRAEKKKALDLNGFPDLSRDQKFGRIISKCWKSEFGRMEDVYESILQAVARRLVYYSLAS
jgi:serine/threonine protein kinase